LKTDEQKIVEVEDKLDGVMMKTGKVTFNDGRVAVVECSNCKLIYLFNEHKPEYFPVGDEVDVLGLTIYKLATNGHTNLQADWVKPLDYEWLHITEDGKELKL
jgi:hypothetical protein